MEIAKRVLVDDFYEQLLNKVPAPVAKRLREMYLNDEDDFINAAKRALPSTDPTYWASSSCKKCYGRGHVGKNLNTGNFIDCKCTHKNYTKWLKNFRESYLEETSNETN